MTIEALVARYGLGAVFAGAAIEGETAVVAGGVLAHHGLLPLAGACVAAATGSFIADQAWFVAGRRFRGHRWVRGLRERTAFARALALFERHPVGFIFAFRFIYGFRTVSPVAIGTSAVPTRTFVLVNAVAAVVWGVAFTLIGWFFGHALEAALGRLRPDRNVLVIGIVTLVTAAALTVAWRWRRRRD
ncbi:DedA family protein [Sphingomonas sp.]|uniref:DedA family protein n=1 Tax=Sphingomonas sp. TaxID=28214 RepID=UPI0035BC5B60